MSTAADSVDADTSEIAARILDLDFEGINMTDVLGEVLECRAVDPAWTWADVWTIVARYDANNRFRTRADTRIAVEIAVRTGEVGGVDTSGIDFDAVTDQVIAEVGLRGYPYLPEDRFWAIVGQHDADFTVGA